MLGNNAVACTCSALLLAALTASYNVDVATPIIKTGAKGSAFSLSLAPFKNDKGKAFILAGAPLAQFNATLTGGLFACPLIGSETNCYSIGNEFMNQNFNVTMDRQLFGQSLTVKQQSADSDSQIHACAPLHRRYIENQSLPREEDKYGVKRKMPTSYYPGGMCVQLNGSLIMNKIDDMCQMADWEHHDHFMCMGGASAAANNDYFVVGAPGAFFLRGSIISSTEPNEDRVTAWTRGEYASVTNYRNLKEPRKFPDLNYYLGYSIAIDPDKPDSDILAGSPWGTNSDSNVLAGSAKLFEPPKLASIKERRTFYGEQTGEGFGYSVALVDLTNDSTAESIVGAPFNAGPMGQNQGVVYIFFNSKASGTVTLLPPKRINKAMFGTAIVSPGDLNKDGFNDLVIGAPGEGDDGVTSGAIYVYHGARERDGIVRKLPSQIIRAQDEGRLIGIRFFGYTVARGGDLDNNSYNDILIGSVESNKAILLRANALVVVEAKISFSTNPINLHKKSCTGNDIINSKDKGNYTCFFVLTSVKFSPKVQSESNPTTKFRISYILTLDVNHEQEQRLFFVRTHRTNVSGTLELKSDKEEIVRSHVYVTSSVVDRYNAFHFRFDYRESGDDFTSPPTQGNTLPSLKPVIERDGTEDVGGENLFSLSTEGSVSILRQCKSSVCKPDLQLSATLTLLDNMRDVSKDFLLAGEGSFLNIDLINRGEEAYQAEVHILLPYGVTFINSTTVYKNDDVDVTCRLVEHLNVSHVGRIEIDCLVANPLKSNEKKVFRVRLQNTFNGDEGNQSILLDATSQGIGDDDNSLSLYFDVRALSILNVPGTFFHEGTSSRLRYSAVASSANRNPRTLNDLGYTITHRYTVRNTGPSTVRNLKLTVWWPVQTKENLDLFYLHSFAIPGDQDNYKCDAEKYVDKCGYVNKLPESEAGCRANYEPITETPPSECEDFHCIPIRCKINRTLVRRASLQIILNATVVAKTLEKKFSKSAPEAFSVLQVNIYKPYFAEPTKFSSSILNRLEPIVVQDCFPAWIIIASIFGGFLILAIIILILYMCGFFREKKEGRYAVRQTKRKPAPAIAMTVVPSDSGELAKETHWTAKSISDTDSYEIKEASLEIEIVETKTVDKIEIVETRTADKIEIVETKTVDTKACLTTTV